MTLTETLLHRHLRFDPADPGWPDRDRLVLARESAAVPAHAAMVVDGPPGLAFGAAVGLAMAERLLAARFGRSLVDHRTWLLAGPRDVVAGPAREAAMAAGALPLGRLAVLASLPETDVPAARRRMLAGYTAAGWTVRTIAEGDAAAADAALSACLRSQKPTLIAEIVQSPHPGTAAAPGPARQQADDEHSLRAAAKRGPGARRSWLKRLRRHPAREAFQHAQSGHLPPGWQKATQPEESPASPHPPAAAPSVQAALARLAAIIPELNGLPLQDVPGLPASPPGAFTARQFDWDGLDHAQAACVLGLALHGGLLPVCWAPHAPETILPALREAARHQLRLLHILPDAEAMPATIPRLLAFAPADPAEALECLGLALRHVAGPSVLALPSQPGARQAAGQPRQSSRGAYLLGPPTKRDLTLLAAGAALPAALAVQAALAARQIAAPVAAMPCRALFDLQDAAYRQHVLGTAPVIAMVTGDRAIVAGLVGGNDLIIVAAEDEPAARVVEAILRHLQRSPG